MARRYYQLPSLTSINSFDACARHRSFTAAAAELGVTLGAVSRQVKSLETELGQKLFKRLQRGVELTPEGEELHFAVKEGFQKIGNLCQAFKLRHRHSEVTLAATTAFASLWLMPRLGDFWLSHRDITLNHAISDNPADASYSNADIRIRYGFGEWPGEQAFKLFGDVIYPVCGIDFKGDTGIRSMSDLAHQPLLQLDSLDHLWTDWKGWFSFWKATEFSLSVRRFNNYVVALQATQENQGIALGWHSQVEPLINSGKLKRVTAFEMPAPGSYYLTWDSNRPLSPGAEALKNWLSSNS